MGQNIKEDQIGSVYFNLYCGQEEAFFKKRFYLFMTERDSKRGTQAEGEAGSLLSRESNMGLDPRTLGS